LTKGARDRSDERGGASPERARLEHLTDLAEGRYEAIVEHAPDAIVVQDVEAGRLVSANAAAERLFGMGRARLLATPLSDLSPPRQPDGRPSGEAAAAHVAAALEGATPRFDWVHLDAAGAEVPCEVSLLRLPDPTRTLVRGSLVDVRERRRAEERARALQAERDAALAQLSSILASAGDGVFGIDREDRVTFANPAAARMLGRAAEDLVGAPAHERWHHTRPDGRPYPRAECPICAASRGGGAHTVSADVFWRPDGTSFPVEYTCAPLVRDDRTVGAVCVFRDVSERLAAEDARRAAAEQAAGRRTAERIQAATAALSATASAGEVAAVGAERAKALLGAEWAHIRETRSGREAARAHAGRAAPGEVISAAGERALREGVTLAFDGAPEPAVATPLAIRGRAVGVLVVGLGARGRLDQVDQGALAALAQQIAQALERAELAAAERRVGERQAFLAEAGRLFSGTLEEGAVLDELARLSVPRIADWCVVHEMTEPGEIRTIALAHRDPARARWAQEASRRYPPDPEAAGGVAAALRSGRSELVEVITDEMIATAAVDEEHLALLRSLGLRSSMTVPVASRGRILAAITLLTGESGERYGVEDLRFAEELARSAGLALDNARLYAEERRERSGASFLAEASGALDAPLGVGARLERLVRLVVPRLADLCTVRLLAADGALHLAALAHADPERERIARRLYPRYVAPADEPGLARVLSRATSEITPDVTDDMLVAYAPDEEFLRDLRRLEPRSVIIVPLIARGQAIGAMSLIAAESGRRYGDRELALAEEVGRRAGLAIENARLFDDERRARAEAESARAAAESAWDRVARLQALGAALGGALDREEVARVILAEAVSALGIAAGAVAIRDGGHGVTVASTGYPPAAAAALERFGVGAAAALATAIRSGRPAWIEHGDPWWPGIEIAGKPAPPGIALPLVVGGTPVGALEIRLPPGRAEALDVDRAFLLAFADQCAQALERAERYEAEHRVALTLQRSLLPAPPASIERAEVALRYLPRGEGLEAGGDWYDVIALPGGRVGVAVGDVVGRGVEAAAIMGQLQSALRALALLGDGPSEVLTRLGRFAATLPQAVMTTVAYCVLDPASGELRHARAGHPPPLVMRRSGAVERLDGRGGVPLGTLEGFRYEEAAALLGPEEALILYSDGLVERRGEVIDEGLVRLSRAVEAVPDASAEETCDRILSSAFGTRPPADDVALLVLRRTGHHAALRRRIPARADALGPLRRELRRWLAAAGGGEEEIGDILLACGEALANAVEHAYHDGDPGEVELRVVMEAEGRIDVMVRDFGRWRTSPRVTDRGRGLALMRSVMEAVRISRSVAGTSVVMRRRIRGDAG
jgi:PAS domain S-box-containing protein